MLTKSWAAEFDSADLRVNAVRPGLARTEGTVGCDDDMLEATAVQAPVTQVGAPKDFARPNVLLASPGAGMIHGAVLPVDGGRLAVCRQRAAVRPCLVSRPCGRRTARTIRHG
ncbi:SDR family oxidoreductase [Streptomyces ossamyceticus]|nr:SDR family oxidoreductase [Streptomyces ossamyceticus]